MTHYVAMDSFRAICYKRERTFDKSISTPKLSALQQKVPQVPTSVKHGYHDYCEQRYDIVLIKDDFLKYGANPKRAQIKTASACG